MQFCTRMVVQSFMSPLQGNYSDDIWDTQSKTIGLVLKSVNVFQQVPNKQSLVGDNGCLCEAVLTETSCMERCNFECFFCYCSPAFYSVQK